MPIPTLQKGIEKQNRPQKRPLRAIVDRRACVVNAPSRLKTRKDYKLKAFLAQPRKTNRRRHQDNACSEKSGKAGPASDRGWINRDKD
jgi:hypothetical protein